MNVLYEYSHFGGSEILQVRFPRVNLQIYQAIACCEVENCLCRDQEVAPSDNSRNAPMKLNTLLVERGFHEHQLEPFMEIAHPVRPASLDRQTYNFVKEQVLVEVQFGKYAFMFYDMAKFQYFYNENKAAVGVEIVACHDLQSEMSSGVAYGEQLVYDIERLKRHFPAVPVKVILIGA